MITNLSKIATLVVALAIALTSCNKESSSEVEEEKSKKGQFTLSFNTPSVNIIKP